MRKVTASAVILTALTGCGQNSGVPSTQWSFEIPSEDEISSLALNRDTAEGTFVSTVDNRALTGKGAIEASDAASNGDMMGPAFNQPPTEIKSGLSTAGISGRSGLGSSVLSLSRAKSDGSISSSGLTSRYQPVAARPDPVAEVKAFLMANGSPSALSNREPYRSDIFAPSLPTVSLPDAGSITSTLDDPTGMESQVAYANSTSFTGAGLPIIESSAGGVYGASGSFASDASTQGQSIYQPVDYSSASAADISVIEASSTTASSDGLADSSATLDEGLPVLEVSNNQEVSLGTAILKDL